MGDDRSDEELFRALPPHAYTFAAGPGPTRARFRLMDRAQVRALLAKLVRRSTARTGRPPDGRADPVPELLPRPRRMSHDGRLVQGRRHLRAARAVVFRFGRRRHRRLARTDGKARLPEGPRRHGALALAVLPVAAQGRRLRHRRLLRRAPRRSATSTTFAGCSTRRTRAT